MVGTEEEPRGVQLCFCFFFPKNCILVAFPYPATPSLFGVLLCYPETLCQINPFPTIFFLVFTLAEVCRRSVELSTTQLCSAGSL